MKNIFESTELGKLIIKNRLVRSATFETAGAENGRITPLLRKIHTDLAKGGAGLIITGMMGISPTSCIHSGMTKTYHDDFCDHLRESVEAVHHFNAKIVVQLSHCGARAKELDGSDYPYAPSDIAFGNVKAKSISVKQIADVVKAFGLAAKKCQEAGSDGVQIHAAHGYLVSQFLSPFYNKRTDAYGGSIEGRAALLLDIYDEIRSQVGRDFPILVKINYTDLVTDGIAEPDVLWYCRELDRRGVDAIEVSAGIGIDRMSSSIQGGRRDEAFNLDSALRLSREIEASIISVGGYRSPGTIAEALHCGNIAAISLSRPLIREPHLPRLWQEGVMKKSTCISCGKCFSSKTYGCYIDQQKLMQRDHS